MSSHLPRLSSCLSCCLSSFISNSLFLSTLSVCLSPCVVRVGVCVVCVVCGVGCVVCVVCVLCVLCCVCLVVCVVCVVCVVVVCGVWCVLCCVCVCGVWWCLVCGVARRKKTSVCRFKTSPCVPAPRAHVLPHAGVVLVHTGDVLNLHTEVFSACHPGREEGRERRKGVTVSSAYQDWST